MRLVALVSGAVLEVWLATAAAAERVLPIVNGGFEQELSGWTAPPGEGMCSVSTEQAASGRASLRVEDNDGVKGSDLTATRVAVGPGPYQLRGRVFPVSGSGLGIYVRQVTADGRLQPGEPDLLGLGGDQRQWRPFTMAVWARRDTAFLELWVHSYSNAKVTAYLDDLEFIEVDRESLVPPWPAAYKLKPEDKARLTPADIVGPDGIVYPNWTRCGVQGGIPDVPVVARLSDFGAMPGDGKDISDALARACAAIGSRGGGALLLDPGTYVLDRPVTIRADGVVIRGSGAAATRVLFRYALPESGIAFYTPDPGRRVGPKTGVELHCLPKDLAKMRILVDDKPVGEWKRGPHSGNSFSFAKTGAAVVAAVPNGPHQLKGVGEYSDGTTRRCDIPVIVDSGFGETPAVAESRAALLFAGPGPVGPKLRLTEDGKRGALQVVLEGTTGLAPGDRILIEAPATDRWKTLTRNACQWGSYRRYEVEVEKIEGTALTLGQPLRLEFPVIDGAYVQKIVPIQRCGVEALTTEQTEDLWISSVLFSNAWNCWARGVIVRKCGRFPIYGAMAKWCEIRDCVFADAWFKGGGGTAYGGWENCWDCLLEGIETFRLRHAPLFQWAASGCVIRKGVFHHSDGQWHSGWTNENLFEQCTIESTTGNGGYGFGLWASPPEDTAHGPNGPRNVVYHCEVTSPRSGLWMGGMNENWLILYNRFTVETGPGVFAKDVSFDHILRGNVFRLRDGKSALLRLATPDCTGVELIDNVLVGGNGQFCEGGGYPALLQANRLEPTGADPHPTPPVPSIYEWQKQQAK